MQQVNVFGLETRNGLYFIKTIDIFHFAKSSVQILEYLMPRHRRSGDISKYFLSPLCQFSPDLWYSRRCIYFGKHFYLYLSKVARDLIIMIQWMTANVNFNFNFFYWRIRIWNEYTLLLSPALLNGYAYLITSVHLHLFAILHLIDIARIATIAGYVLSHRLSSVSAILVIILR